jgi:hypothetical protein
LGHAAALEEEEEAAGDSEYKYVSIRRYPGAESETSHFDGKLLTATDLAEEQWPRA